MKNIAIYAVLLAFSFISSVNADEKQSSSALTVVVSLEVKPGNEEQLKKELQKVVALSRKESSCILYEIYQDLSNPSRVIFYEQWTSKEDHDKQFEKQYIIDFCRNIEGMLAKPYDAVMAQKLI